MSNICIHWAINWLPRVIFLAEIHLLLAEQKYYSGKNITCGNEILLAGIQYYSRKWIITRGKKYYSRERIITRGNLFITRGNDILFAGEKYWQYMAPEGFRIDRLFNPGYSVNCVVRTQSASTIDDLHRAMLNCKVPMEFVLIEHIRRIWWDKHCSHTSVIYL